MLSFVAELKTAAGIGREGALRDNEAQPRRRRSNDVVDAGYLKGAQSKRLKRRTGGKARTPITPRAMARCRAVAAAAYAT